jgi:hypothetical protein
MIKALTAHAMHRQSAILASNRRMRDVATGRLTRLSPHWPETFHGGVSSLFRLQGVLQ